MNETVLEVRLVIPKNSEQSMAKTINDILETYGIYAKVTVQK